MARHEGPPQATGPTHSGLAQFLELAAHADVVARRRLEEMATEAAQMEDSLAAATAAAAAQGAAIRAGTHDRKMVHARIDEDLASLEAALRVYLQAMPRD